ncbi:hypothetical protein C8R47DRAFT_1101452 [Mycena vitilis]|nr:hypothetical protein C8R47DRAFT_1101452 [Mycena vitilis]
MHDCVKLRNLAKIGGSLRPIAEAAAGGSAKDLLRLCSLIGTLAKTLAVLTLPASFANLDPAGIPDPDELDNLSTKSSERIRCADISLRLVLHVVDVIPAAAYPEIWVRVWPWLDFLQTYCDNLPSFDAGNNLLPPNLVHHAHAAIIANLAYDAPTKNSIGSTSGVRRILAMAWKDLVEDLWGQPQYGGLENANQLFHLLQPRPGNRTDFDEISEAVGGGAADFASVLVNHVARATSQGPPDPRIGEFLSTAITALDGGVGPSLIETAAQSFRLAPVLVTTILALYGPLRGEAWNPVDMCLVCLMKALKCSPGYPYVVQALRAGLLRCILVTGESPGNRPRHPDAKSTSTLIMDLLNQIWPSLAHYKVLLQLKVSFPEAEELALSLPLTPNSSFSEHWRGFSSLVAARLRALENWEEESAPSFKGCANALCAKIDARRRFKTCSTCQRVDYCSTQCQATDWCDGHKVMCKELQIYHSQRPETISTRGRCFMRALLTHEFSLNFASICMKQVLFMYQYPGEAFMIAFGYWSGTETLVEIHPKTFSDAAQGWDPDLPAQFARAEKSEGRLQVHIVFTVEGQMRRVRVVPLHTTSSALRDGLQRVAESIPDGMSADEAWQWARDDVDSIVEEASKTMTFVH